MIWTGSKIAFHLKQRERKDCSRLKGKKNKVSPNQCPIFFSYNRKWGKEWLRLWNSCEEWKHLIREFSLLCDQGWRPTMLKTELTSWCELEPCAPSTQQHRAGGREFSPKIDKGLHRTHHTKHGRPHNIGSCLAQEIWLICKPPF